jgi:plastocyanin
MDTSTIFYICGSVLAASAVIVSFVGLRLERFPGRAAPVVVLGFAALVLAATTFAVRNGQEEQQARASELEVANEEALREEESPEPGGKEQAGGGAGQPAAKGPGGTLQLAADPTQIAFDKETLDSKPGKVTIEFTNPATIEHDVAIEQNGKQLAVSERITKGKTSVTVDLAPGAYTFLCTVPGHAEAGMEGTLTVR